MSVKDEQIKELQRLLAIQERTIQLLVKQLGYMTPMVSQPLTQVTTPYIPYTPYIYYEQPGVYTSDLSDPATQIRNGLDYINEKYGPDNPQFINAG